MNVALYARVSTDDQAERGTVGVQVDFFRRWCELHGHTSAGEYIDEGVSGVVPVHDRPAGARLLAGAGGGQFEQVALFRLDRLARDTGVALNAVKTLEGRGVRLVSMTEAFDTNTASGRLMLDILASFAGFERNAIRERADEGRRKKATAGGWLGGVVPPYGYVVEGRGAEARLAPDETPEPTFGGMTRAHIVRWIYAQVAGGVQTATGVARHLTAIGLPTSTGRGSVWANEHIVRLIRRVVYRGVQERGAGNARSNLRGIETPCAALVDADTWQRAADRLVANRRFSRPESARDYLLRGLITCFHCGGTYTGYVCKGSEGKLSDNTGGGTSYRCHRQASGSPCPGNPKAVSGDIEDFVWGEVLVWLAAPETIEKATRAVAPPMNGATGNERGTERARLVAARERKEAERQAVLKIFRQGLIGERDRAAQFADIAAETTVLDSEIARLDAAAELEREGEAVAVDAGRAVRDIAGQYLGRISAMTRGAKRELIELLVSRVEVTTRETGRVFASGRTEREATARVYFRFPAPPTGKPYPTSITTRPAPTDAASVRTSLTAVPTAVPLLRLCLATWPP